MSRWRTQTPSTCSRARRATASSRRAICCWANDSTADEGATLAALVRERRWTRIIVVTSKVHTRRAGYIMRRALAGTPASVIVRASRVDLMDPDHWWRERSDRRFVLFETQKMLAYLVGLD